ncbi:Aldose 1-epimerase precursor [Paraliobacillus sp. PM-2]|uniref:aldose epimerase family protein n=1 Tax=Paraliobacillus sp. PM-2 TaxID=1462524 RepID=UPI00061C798D|nr:aldose epimerase family protein [Paraliobacillus sp. PM-2]CQR46062.1 Aldose 1-epimerase precursor [Paraliobacillus sp. PM-2]
MNIQEKKHTVAGQNWTEYTFNNDQGMSVSCLNYGGIITNITVPDRNGKMENVVLSYADYEDYLDNPNFFGALVGRVAGRIESASFTVDGKTYTLPANEGNHHLHGGKTGFNQIIWDTTPFKTDKQVGINLSHVFPDGEGGYPGELEVTVTYALTNENDFKITYQAKSDQNTILATTNHSYFNLSGDLKKDILHHEVQMDASQFVELDHELIPTGKILSVDDTVFDFRKAHPIIDGVHSVDQQNLVASNGFDHYFIFDHHTKPNVIVTDQESGRKLEMETNQPGMVMYTSNGLDETFKLKERDSTKYLGLCLETQASPASLKHDGFPSIFLDKDEVYHKTTTFSFRTMD